MTTMTLKRARTSRLADFCGRWSARELIIIGVFAATAKVSTVLIAMVGGGMNPLFLLLKNMVFTTLLVVMLFKVCRPGTLCLFVIVSSVVNFLLLGGNLTLIPPMLLAAVIAELLMRFIQKNNLPGAVYWGVGCFDLLCKFGSLGISFLMMRESPAMMAAVVPIVIIGYIGSLIGLWTGSKSIKELRHAGLIRS